jgi:hypothetical protein
LHGGQARIEAHPAEEVPSADPVFSTQARSSDGAFRFAVDDTQLSVWRGAQKRRVGHARFTFKNAVGRFVAGNNILVTAATERASASSVVVVDRVGAADVVVWWFRCCRGTRQQR